MKRVLLSSISFILLLILVVVVLKTTNTYAYGVDISVVNNNGTISLVYRDQDTGYLISPQTAVKYYEEAYAYDSRDYNGKIYYFHYGKQISEAEYNRGVDTERADYQALMYGKNAYRVHNTSEVKKAFDDIYGKQRYGEFVIVFSDAEYQAIDWNSVKSYYNNKYSISPSTINYYRYDHYGEWLANRWGWSWNLNTIRDEGMIAVDTSAQIRLSGDQKQVLEKMGDKVVAKILSGINTTDKLESDFIKISRAFNFIGGNGRANYDVGFYPSLIESSTDAYSTLLKGKSVCIGYAVTFSYLMDRLGINSYIVDNISVNTSTHEVETFHSYNIVELGGKYYAIDISSRFLKGISSSELKGANLANVSRTDFNVGGRERNWDISAAEKQSMRAAAEREVKTTTTKRAYTTTTYKPTTVPKGNESTYKTTKGTTTKTTTTKKTTTKKTTTGKTTEKLTPVNTSTGTISQGTTKPAQTYTIIVQTTKKSTSTISPETDQTTTVPGKVVRKEKFKLYKVTIICIAVGGTLLIISLIFIIKNRRKVPFNY